MSVRLVPEQCCDKPYLCVQLTLLFRRKDAVCHLIAVFVSLQTNNFCPKGPDD